eukprot:2215291-Prymnesium_polylepis.1
MSQDDSTFSTYQPPLNLSATSSDIGKPTSRTIRTRPELPKQALDLAAVGSLHGFADVLRRSRGCFAMFRAYFAGVSRVSRLSRGCFTAVSQ